MMRYVRPGSKADEAVSVKVKPEGAVLVLDRLHYDKVLYLMNHVSTEVQWRAIIERLDNEDTQGKYVYFVHDLFIPKQTVGPDTVETTPAEYSDLWLEVMKERGLTVEELDELTRKSHFWGHSHVEMPTKPSADDEDQWKELVKDADKCKGIAGMIIMNRKNQCFIRIYDTQTGLEITNPLLRIADPTDYDDVDRAIDTKLTLKKKPEPVAAKQYGSTTPPATLPPASPPVGATQGGTYPSTSTPSVGGTTGQTSTHVGAAGLSVVWDDSDPPPLSGSPKGK